MKYINLFETQAAYDAANKYYPNVSYIEATDEVKYQETDPTLIVAKFTTTSANQNVRITYNQALFSDITIEGQSQTIGTGILNHTFAVAGEHEVIYKFNSTPNLYNVFNGCNAMTSIVIPKIVNYIGNSSFESCTKLSSVTIPDTVTRFGNNSFWSCTALPNINISNSVTYIDTGAFGGCTSLTSLNIPASVTNIPNTAGGPCYDSSNITSITVDSGNTVYNDGNGSNCIIKTSTNELIQGCKNTVIPNTVTKIGNLAFRTMGLTGALNIPASVTSIGNQAFLSNMGLTSITCLATTPPTIQSNTFQNVPATCAIYVPAASVDAYKAANGWSERADYIQAIP